MKVFSTENVKLGFHKFCDTTSMHGFQELYYAKAKFWTSVWIVACVGSVILTFFHVYNATLQYAESAHITQVSTLDKGELTLPTLSLCYIHWLYWVDWKKGFELGFTREQLLYSFSVLNVIYSPTVFNITETKEGLIQQMAVNNITGIGQLFKTLAKPLPLVIGESTNTRLDPNPFLNEIKFLFKTDRIYLCYSLNGESIKKMIGAQKKSSSSTRSNGNALSFSVQDPEYKYYSDYLSMEEYNFYMAHWLMYFTNYWALTLDDYRKDYTHFALPIRLYTDSYSKDFAEIITENDAYTISMVTSVHRWMNTKDRQCNEREKAISTEDKCGDLCLAKFQKQERKCYDLDQTVWNNADMPGNICLREIKFIPLLVKAATSTESTTVSIHTNVASAQSTNSYTNAPQVRNNGSDETLKLQLEDEYNNCTNSCIYACETWRYYLSVSIKTVASAARKITFKNATDVKIIYPEEDDILIMIEIDARTWEDFVANVGGLLGVWTGASLLSFLQVFYLCCFTESTCDFCNYKRLRGGGSGVQRTNVEMEQQKRESGVDEFDSGRVHKRNIVRLVDLEPQA